MWDTPPHFLRVAGISIASAVMMLISPAHAGAALNGDLPEVLMEREHDARLRFGQLQDSTARLKQNYFLLFRAGHRGAHVLP